MSLLPICGKVMESYYTTQCSSFSCKKIDHLQSVGFKTGDWCINQFISITHEIYESFDGGYDDGYQKSLAKYDN